MQHGVLWCVAWNEKWITIALYETHHSQQLTPIRCKYLFHFVQSDNSEYDSNGRWMLVACATNYFPIYSCVVQTSKRKIRSTERIEFVQHTFSACMWHFVLHWQLSKWQLVVEALCMQMFRLCIHIAHCHIHFENNYWNFFRYEMNAIPHIHVSMD